MYIRFGKRALDIFLCILALIPALLVMVVIAVQIKMDDPRGKIFFRQTRIGKGEKTFKILKFRSMKPDTPRHLSDKEMTSEFYDKNVTKIGKILRKYSLDEIPQIFNILAGDMSIIGPRPVVRNETDLLEERKKHGVTAFRPGLTGWAQINGRNYLKDEEKLRYDIEYCQRISFLFDLECFFRTIPVVLTKKGFSEGRDRVDPKADFEVVDELRVEDELGLMTYTEDDIKSKEEQYM